MDCDAYLYSKGTGRVSCFIKNLNKSIANEFPVSRVFFYKATQREANLELFGTAQIMNIYFKYSVYTCSQRIVQRADPHHLESRPSEGPGKIGQIIVFFDYYKSVLVSLIYARATPRSRSS